MRYPLAALALAGLLGQANAASITITVALDNGTKASSSYAMSDADADKMLSLYGGNTMQEKMDAASAAWALSVERDTMNRSRVESMRGATGVTLTKKP